jgi:hypothetical protein
MSKHYLPIPSQASMLMLVVVEEAMVKASQQPIA